MAKKVLLRNGGSLISSGPSLRTARPGIVLSERESERFRLNRPMGMDRTQNRGWRRVAIIAALLCAAASVKVMANPEVRRPVAQFIYFYQQTDDMFA